MFLFFKSRVLCFIALSTYGLCSHAATLEEQLKLESSKSLAEDATMNGDARRGAVVFYQGYMTCTKCHVAQEGNTQLGPKLSEIDAKITKQQIVDSVLNPSKEIKKEYQAANVVTEDGKSVVGLFVRKSDTELVLRDPSTGKLMSFSLDRIEDWEYSQTSVMPKGLVNQLTNRQQFLDLSKYLFEVAEGGAQREAELKPPASMYVSKIPEYEANIDHAGMIEALDGESLKRGAAIYNRLCINCHGTVDKPGSLPTSLRFASGKFKNGHDPYAMYQTLTKGYGMMVAQAWMVPQQKYDVIHYIRETYLKPHHASQLFAITDSYLASLPKGDSTGPAPSNIEPWSQMDYGPRLVNTYEIGSDGSNFAYKGIAMRLDSGPGGVSQGRHWTIFDHDTMRVAAAWSGEGFINWHGIHFDGRHGAHPRIVGDVQFQNPTGPGWAKPGTDDFEDNRLVGRDGRRYGPLDREWAHYKGLYRFQDRTVISYTVGQTPVLEAHDVDESSANTVFTRSLTLGPRDTSLSLQLANLDEQATVIEDFRIGDAASAVLFGVAKKSAAPPSITRFAFDGSTRLLIDKPKHITTDSKDFSVTARIKTKTDGSIWTHSKPNGEWVSNGKSLFIRDGRLVFDIGWVGEVASRKKVADGKWHDVALTYRAMDGKVALFIDEKLSATGRLPAKKPIPASALSIGYTSTNFPSENTHFKGEISKVEFFQRVLSEGEIRNVNRKGAVSVWRPKPQNRAVVKDESDRGNDAKVVRGQQPAAFDSGLLAVALTGDIHNVTWSPSENGQLRLQFPAGDPMEIQVQQSKLASVEEFEDFCSVAVDPPPVNLQSLTRGGPVRYPEELKSQPIIGADDGPFAVDVLTHPEGNPWFCRMRLTGIDFFDSGDEGIVTAWDGNIWRVTGFNRPENGLTWRRIADGLFQPLGVRIVDGEIYVTCRDQLVHLQDLNDDGEIDFYRNHNNDHQVTEHFHEFAMGLQTDDLGNFYYAKSARHAKKALVPHHGTLLRISKNGLKTDILARGFRAANGVCLNSDGTFIVTDQEGHWNPKNRINWVSEGGFYGNMWGYHDVTDSSDEAMEQPLCWITNAFDRSPAELLWVKSKAWGPLDGTLLNLSYGYGKVYVVPHEKIKGQVQGGMCQIQIPQFPTGVMRGRFHPANGQLYCCGMFAWAGTQHQPGGLYRIRYTGKPVHLPLGLEAKKNGVKILFSGRLDPGSLVSNRFQVKVWDLKRTGNYGSKHFNERSLDVVNAYPANDGFGVFLEIPEIDPTWCMEIKYDVRGSNGESVQNRIHNTIHHLGD